MASTASPAATADPVAASSVAFEAIRDLEEGAAYNGGGPTAPADAEEEEEPASGTGTIAASPETIVSESGTWDSASIFVEAAGSREAPSADTATVVASPSATVSVRAAGAGAAREDGSVASPTRAASLDTDPLRVASPVSEALPQAVASPSRATRADGAAGATITLPAETGDDTPDADQSSELQRQPSSLDLAMAWAQAVALADGVDLALQFACPICLEVCEDAVETSCCYNLFCQGCLLSEEHRITRCPICKCALAPAAVVANVPVRRVIADMPCACRFDGCRAQLRRRSRARHEAECPFMPVRCTQSPSCPPLLRGNVAIHEATECPCRPSLCPLGCGVSLPFNRLEEHLDRDCPRVLIRCPHCEAGVCRSEFAEHLQSICPALITQCGFLEEGSQAQCGYRCERRHLAEHQRVCSFRPTQCQHEGCQHTTTARLLRSHEEVCQWRRTECPECHEEMPAGLLQEHLEATCPDRLVACPLAPYGCSDVIPRRFIEEHLQQASGRHIAQLCHAVSSRDSELAAMRTELQTLRRDLDEQKQRQGQARSSFERSNSGHGIHPILNKAVPSTKASPPLPPSPPPQQPNRTVRASEDERWPLLELPPDHEISLGMEPIFWDEGRSGHSAGTAPAAGSTSSATGRGSTVMPKPKAAPPAVSSLNVGGYVGGDATAAPVTVLAAGPALQAPGPAWEREFAPPGALQPLVLLREGGISQVPLFVPPRRYNMGTSRGTSEFPSSMDGGVEPPPPPGPPPPPPQLRAGAGTMSSSRLGGPVSPRSPGYRAAGPCVGVGAATSRPPVPPVPPGQPPRSGGPRLVGPGQRGEESMEL